MLGVGIGEISRAIGLHTVQVAVFGMKSTVNSVCRDLFFIAHILAVFRLIAGHIVQETVAHLLIFVEPNLPFVSVVFGFQPSLLL